MALGRSLVFVKFIIPASDGIIWIYIPTTRTTTKSRDHAWDRKFSLKKNRKHKDVTKNQRVYLTNIWLMKLAQEPLEYTTWFWEVNMFVKAFLRFCKVETKENEQMRPYIGGGKSHQPLDQSKEIWDVHLVTSSKPLK